MRQARFLRWEHRYGLLLLLILLVLVFQLAAPEQDWARLVTIGLQSATLILALYTSEVNPVIIRGATAVVIVAILGSTGVLVGSGRLGTGAAHIVNVGLVALAPVVIGQGVIRSVREEGTVTLHTMFGVLCIYLLLGSLFAFAFGVVGDAQSGPFFAEQSGGTLSDYLYFSFSTLTTTGYGDLTAVTDLGRSMAIAESLLGQIYLVTVVAVIVGNLRRT
jgi:hypothetical protein